jgi:hypothetical protein
MAVSRARDSRLVEGVGHPHRRQLAGAVQPGQAHGITPLIRSPDRFGINEGATTAQS